MAKLLSAQLEIGWFLFRASVKIFVVSLRPLFSKTEETYQHH